MALRSSSSPWWAVETALQELQKLESEHPDRFDYLKRELKSLIAEPLFTSRDPTIPTLLPASSAATQGEYRTVVVKLSLTFFFFNVFKHNIYFTLFNIFSPFSFLLI